MSESSVAVMDEVARALAALDVEGTRKTYWDQNEFIVLERWLPAALVERMVAEVERVRPAIHRNYIPRHKKGGSVSYYTLREQAPDDHRPLSRARLHRLPERGDRGSRCSRARSRTRIRARCTSTRSPAITSASTSTRRTTRARGTRCSSGSSSARRAASCASSTRATRRTPLVELAPRDASGHRGALQRRQALARDHAPRRTTRSA